MTNTRSTVPYTAKVLARFSTEFQGFLRWGGGGNDPNTNYHVDWRGSGDRPTVNYKFGDASVPFYTALDRESSTGQRPWLWHDLKINHGGVQGIINTLTDENKYTITLTGRFEDVIGKQVQFTWGDAESTRKRSVTERETDDSAHKTITTVSKAGPNDAPAPNPDPPSVDEPENNNTTTTEHPQVVASGGSGD